MEFLTSCEACDITGHDDEDEPLLVCPLRKGGPAPIHEGTLGCVRFQMSVLSIDAKPSWDAIEFGGFWTLGFRLGCVFVAGATGPAEAGWRPGERNGFRTTSTCLEGDA